MGRTGRMVLALALVGGACGTGGEAPGDSASESASRTSSSTTTSTTLATTTTRDPCAGDPFSIDEGGSTSLFPGCRYRTEEFLLFPIEFEVEQDGWLVFDIDDQRLVFVSLDTNADGGTDADVAILTWTPEGADSEQLDTEALLAGLEDIEDLAIASEPVTAMVAGLTASTVDVEAGENPIFTGFKPCSTSGLDFSNDEPGFQLITITGSGKGDIGFPACGRTRVWIVETADQPFLILAAPNDRDRFEEFMPLFEEFLQSNVTFGDADG